MVVSLIGIMAAVALPVLKDVTGNIKLAEASRLVERELQSARLKAVSANRLLRVRSNCPAAGYIRTVEVVDPATDSDANRCNPTTYPFPASDQNIITRPNFDGPVRTLPTGATVTSAIIEFAPDGTARKVVAGVATAIDAPVTITVSRDGKSRSVTINGAGKVQYAQ